MEDVRQRRVTLYTCFILFIVGSAVILWANSNYNSIFWKRRLIYPSQGITFETDTSTQFSAISWFIYTSNEQTAESKWKTVQLDLDPLFRSSPQFNLTVIVPNKAYLDESQMTIFSFVENCLYDEIYESTTIKINFETPRLTFCFNWEILSQESYDRYQIYMLLYPKFINCTSEEYTVKVYNLPKATIDLSRTFPHPTSSHCHPPEYPTYHWRLTNVQDVAEEVSPTMLQISFVFPEKTSQKERIVFESGVLFGFGTAFILNGLVRIFLLIGTEWVQVKGYIMHRGKLLVLIIFVLFVALISVLSYCFPSLINDILNWGWAHWLSIVALVIGSLSFFLPIYYYHSLEPRIEVFFANREPKKEIVVKVAEKNDKMFCLENRGKRDISVKKICVLFPIKQVRFFRHPDAVSSGFLLFHEEEIEHMTAICYFPSVPSVTPPFSKKPSRVCYPVLFTAFEKGMHDIKVVIDVQISQFDLGLLPSIFSRRRTYRIENKLTIKATDDKD